jgi:hypothetical protein
MVADLVEKNQPASDRRIKGPSETKMSVHDEAPPRDTGF